MLCPSLSPGSAINTLKLFEAGASLQGPLQAPAHGQFSLARQEEILIKVTGEESLLVLSRVSGPKAPIDGTGSHTLPLWRAGFLALTQGAAPCDKPPQVRFLDWLLTSHFRVP